MSWSSDIHLVTPSALTPGQQFRYAFITKNTTNATSSDITTYNNFVNNELTNNGFSVKYNNNTITAVALVSADVDARDNVGSFDSNIPVYLVNGIKIADTHNVTSTSGSSLYFNSTTQSWTSPGISRSIDNVAYSISVANRVWTGSNSNGMASTGGALGNLNCATSVSAAKLSGGSALNTNSYRLFALTEVLTVPNPNSAPTDISLNNLSIAENNAIGAVIGTLSTTDPDSNQTFTYSLVGGETGAFDISGDLLRAAIVFDYETKSSYAIQVRSTDQGGLSRDVSFNITVTNQLNTIVGLTGPTSITQGQVSAYTASVKYETSDFPVIIPEPGINESVINGYDDPTFQITPGTYYNLEGLASSFNNPINISNNKLKFDNWYMNTIKNNGSNNLKDAFLTYYKYDFTTHNITDNYVYSSPFSDTIINDASGNVDLYIDSSLNQTKELINGSATFDVSFNDAGNHTVQAVFEAQGIFDVSESQLFVSVSPKPTTQVTLYSNNQYNAFVNQTVTLTATLQDNTSTLLSGKSVTLSLDGVGDIATKTTDESGMVSFDISHNQANSYNYTATFNSDETYIGDYESFTQYILAYNTTTTQIASYTLNSNGSKNYLSPSSATIEMGETIYLDVSMSYVNGFLNPSLTIGDIELSGNDICGNYGIVSLDQNVNSGKATFAIYSQNTPGTYDYTISYLGTIGYNPSSTSFSLTVSQPSPSQITLTSSNQYSAYVNDTVTLTATLTNLTTAEPLFGRSLILYINQGEILDTQITDSSGIATFDISQSSANVYEYKVQYLENFVETIFQTFNSLNNPPSITTTSPVAVAEGNNSVPLNANESDVGDTLTWSLVPGIGDSDNSLFDISASTGILTLKSGNFDYETQTSYSVRVQVSDGTDSDVKAITINVTNVNETPSNITLTPSTINERNAIGAVIGTLSTNDPDVNNTFTYSLIGGETGAFDISGDKLLAKVVFDYETKSSYQIRIKSTDQGGLSKDLSFNIGINDVNDGPGSSYNPYTMAAGKVSTPLISASTGTQIYFNDPIVNLTQLSTVYRSGATGALDNNLGATGAPTISVKTASSYNYIYSSVPDNVTAGLGITGTNFSFVFKVYDNSGNIKVTLNPAITMDIYLDVSMQRITLFTNKLQAGVGTNQGKVGNKFKYNVSLTRGDGLVEGQYGDGNASGGSDPHITTIFGKKYDFHPSTRKTYTMFKTKEINVTSHFTGLKHGVFADRVNIDLPSKEKLEIDFNKRKIRGASKSIEVSETSQDIGIRYNNKTQNKSIGKTFIPKNLTKLSFKGKNPVDLYVDYHTRYVHFRFPEYLPVVDEMSGMIVEPATRLD